MFNKYNKFFSLVSHSCGFNIFFKFIRDLKDKSSGGVKNVFSINLIKDIYGEGILDFSANDFNPLEYVEEDKKFNYLVSEYYYNRISNYKEVINFLSYVEGSYDGWKDLMIKYYPGTSFISFRFRRIFFLPSSGRILTYCVNNNFCELEVDPINICESVLFENYGSDNFFNNDHYFWKDRFVQVEVNISVMQISPIKIQLSNPIKFGYSEVLEIKNKEELISEFINIKYCNYFYSEYLIIGLDLKGRLTTHAILKEPK